MLESPPVETGPSVDPYVPRMKWWRKMFAHCTPSLAFQLFYSSFFGGIKGLVMLPILVPLLTLSVLFINVSSYFTWINHGVATLRFTKLLGPNIKTVGIVLLPLALLLYIPLSTVAALLASLPFVLVYPVVATLNDKRQTAWRYTYFQAGWRSTMEMTSRILSSYQGICTVWSLDKAKEYRTAKLAEGKEPWDIHPGWQNKSVLVFITSLLMLFLGTVLEFVVKSVPMLLRAYLNHGRAADSWGAIPWRRGFSCRLLVPYYLLFLAFPGAVVAIPFFAMGYAVRFAARAARATYQAKGSATVGWALAWKAMVKIEYETTKYLLGQDSPELEAPVLDNIHIGWVFAGFIPALVGLIVVPLLMSIVSVIAVVPVFIAAMMRVTDTLANTSKGLKAQYLPALIFLLVTLPGIVPAAVFSRVLLITLRSLRAIAIVNRHRSFEPGFKYIFALIYASEYRLNKFAYQRTPGELVHWASVLPPLWGVWAQPYMPAEDFDGGLETHVPVSIVGKPARYVPRGTRRPQTGLDGAAVDMTAAGYIIPGVGIAPLQPGGTLGPVIPTASSVSASSVEALTAATYSPTRAVPPRHLPVVAEEGSAPSPAPAEAPVARRRGRWCMCCMTPEEAEEERDEVYGVVREKPAPAPAPLAVAVAAAAGPEAVAIEVAEPAPAAAETAPAAAAPASEADQAANRVSAAAQAIRAGAAAAVATIETATVTSPSVGSTRLLPVTTTATIAEAVAPVASAASPMISMRRLVLESSPSPAAPAATAGAGSVLSPAASMPQPARFVERDDEDDEDAEFEEGEDEEEEDEEDEIFTLQPVTRPELPDKWIAVEAPGTQEVYFVNYARNQSAWKLPPGYEVSQATALRP